MSQYTLLRYKDFLFPYNPRRFTVEGSKQMFHQFAPGLGSIVTQLGSRARMVKGEGQFFGPDAKERFEALWALFCEKEDGLLALPALPPFYAYFSSLTLLGEAGFDGLTYAFTFLESDREVADLCTEAGTVTAGAGQTIWHLAAGTGTTVENLYRANPVLYTGELTEGMEVKLK